MSYEYYSILGIDRSATADEIKKAYRKKAMELHPDRTGWDKEKEALFKEVGAAYETLSDPQKKAYYDQTGTPPGQGGGWFGGFEWGFSSQGFGGFGDIFEQFFNGGSTQQSRSHGGEDEEAELVIDFADSYKWWKFELKYERYDLCGTCDGSGAKSGSKPVKCSHCHGSGQVRERVRTIFGVMEQATVCGVCQGSGETISDPCSTCHGKKRLRKKTTQTVEIPAGIADGVTLKMRGEGSIDTKNKSRWDLYIHISVVETPHMMQREKDHIHFVLTLHPVELILGIKKNVKIPVVGDRSIDIPAGTQPDHVIKMKWDGFPSLSRRDSRWDLYIHLQVEIPKKLSKKERELYEAIAHEKGIGWDEEKGFFEKIFCD